MTHCKPFHLIISILVFFPFCLTAQKHGTYTTVKPGFYQQEIKRPGTEIITHQRQVYGVVFDDLSYPADTSEYRKIEHLPPLSQGATGTCWCFAAISMMESEILRITGEKIKLSEMYIVYWEYVERAKAFVKNRGDIYFAQGSEAVSVPRIMSMYGIVPASIYPGKPENEQFHDHDKVFEEMEVYLASVEREKAWNQQLVESTIRSILDHYFGVPPEQFEYRGKEMTPKGFLNEVTGLVPNDYFSFMSTQSQPYHQKGELIEPDNWWHCQDYYNVHIDELMQIIDDALEGNYSVCICGDVSEPGFDKYREVGIIPDFDIPPQFINEDAREYRLFNGSTTDDHCMHLIGRAEKDRWRWYLVKDSGSGAFDGPNKGYRFIREDYIQLKMMNIMVHKLAAKQILDKIIK